MEIPSEYCKSFFNITDVNEMYPHLTRTQAEKLKNHFCFRTLYYIGELRGYLKEHLLHKIFKHIIKKLKKEKKHNYSHALFYKMLINELNDYKQAHEYNYTFLDNILLLEHYARNKLFQQ